MSLIGQRNYYEKGVGPSGIGREGKRHIDQRESSSTARFNTIFEDRDG